MKIVAIDGSPHGEKGNTALLLEQFVAGAMATGAEVERVPAYRMRVEPCCGRMVCWYRTPGVCIHKDDATGLIDRMAAADAWVLATPVHLGGMSEGLVRIMERTVALLSPMFEVHDNRTRHVASPYHEGKAVVLIATCGYYEETAFEPLVSQIVDLSMTHHRRFAGALLRPHGLALRYMKSNGLDVDDVLDAARRAGAELAGQGSVRSETLAAVRRPLLDRDDFILMMNSAFERRLGCQPGRTPGCGPVAGATK